MRIALDTNPLFVTQAGVARYIRGLKKGLATIAPADLVFVDCAWEVTNFGYQQPWRAMKTAYRELFWANVCAPRLLSKWQVDVFHSTGPLIITPPEAIRQVVTLHDLAVLRYPERFRRWCRRSIERGLSKIAKANRVLCISQFTADEAIKLLGLPAHQLEVVYNGCDFRTIEFYESTEPGFAVPSEFFLFVGSLEPGKNLSLLREVYLRSRNDGKPLPPLLIAGARWEGTTGEGVPPDDWHYLGRVTDEALIYLYKRAIALVFPSKYEGFGFPILEAMGLGCPVVCSPVASLPEIAGGATLMPALKPEAYVKAMRRIAGDPELREELVRKGHVQAQKFSWEKCANETVEVYRQAYT